MLDATDLRILDILQQDARTSNAEIARQIALAPSAVFQRIRKLEESRVIRGYHARVDPAAMDLGLLAFVAVQTTEGARAGETAELLAAIPEVVEVHRVVGDDCFLLKVRVRDTAALGALLDEQIQPLAPVASTRTTIVLSSSKDGTALPMPALGGPIPASESTSRKALRAL